MYCVNVLLATKFVIKVGSQSNEFEGNTKSTLPNNLISIINISVDKLAAPSDFFYCSTNNFFYSNQTFISAMKMKHLRGSNIHFQASTPDIHLHKILTNIIYYTVK